MGIDRLEFISWMQRMMERFDVLEKLAHSKTNDVVHKEADELLDNQDLLLMLKVSARSLQRYRSKGILPYYCISGKIYYKRSDVAHMIQEGFVRCVDDRKFKKLTNK